MHACSARCCGLVAVLWISWLGGCGDFSDVARFEQQDEVSECNGFTSLSSPLRQVPPPYCDANVLAWTYQAEGGTLELTDLRVLLNCCGDHAMQLSYRDGVYEALETDEPEGGFGRCDCMCVFDFRVTAQGLPAETIRLRIRRQVSDWDEASGVVFEGDLELGQGHGFVVIDSTDVGPWCEPHE